MQRARKGARFKVLVSSGLCGAFCKCPEQSGINWAQMGHRGVDPMGTRCPLHPISSLSHGGFSLGRERRDREEESKAHRLRCLILGGRKKREKKNL